MNPARDYLRAAWLLYREQIWEELADMAFKGSKPSKGGEDKGKDVANVLEMYRELANTQQAAIHALAAALGATEADKDDEDEEDEEDENDEEDEEDKDK